MTEKMERLKAKMDDCNSKIKHYNCIYNDTLKEYCEAEAEYAFDVLGIKIGDRVTLNSKVLWWSSKWDETVRFVNVEIKSIRYRERDGRFDCFCTPYTNDWKVSLADENDGVDIGLKSKDDIKEKFGIDYVGSEK